MAIGGANGIGFDPTVPADTESAGLGDDRIRSTKTSVQLALDAEHNFPSGGGDSIAYHRYGSARPYWGTQSQVSSSGSDGRLMLTSDTSRLFGVGSGGTVYLGGAYDLSVGTTAGVSWPQRSRWVTEFGAGITNSVSGQTTVTIPSSGFSGVPFITVTSVQTNTTPVNVLFTACQIDGQTFTVTAISPGAGTVAGNMPFHWLSHGTRAL